MPCFVVVNVIAIHKIAVIVVTIVIGVIPMLQSKSIIINENTLPSENRLYFVSWLLICNPKHYLSYCKFAVISVIVVIVIIIVISIIGVIAL